MKRTMIILLLCCFTLYGASAFAAKLKTGEKKDQISSEKHFKDIKSLDLAVHALKGEIEELRAVVARLQALQPTFATFMPEFSERFHVMHLAGEAGDWGVAAHELSELKRLVGLGKLIDPTKGRLMESFMSGDLHKINEAISHGNEKAFLKAMNDSVENCNRCHVAGAAAYIKVSLNLKEILNIRHSHKFVRTKPGSIVPHKH